MRTIQYLTFFLVVVTGILFWGVWTGRFDPKLLRPSAIQSIIEHFTDALITLPNESPAVHYQPENNIPDLPSPEIEELRIREIETYPSIEFHEEDSGKKLREVERPPSGYSDGDIDIA